jgi:hypothetical protein
VALRRVYGGGWLGVLLRAAALAFLHLMLLALAITVVLMVGALGG